MYGNNGPQELGGIDGIAGIADRQIGPTCGFEAVENIVQLFVPARNDLSSTTLLPMASQAGYLVPGVHAPMLVTPAFRPLLARFGIATTWASFDHQQLIDALAQNRVAIAIIDAYYLGSATYRFRNSWHAVIITNFVTDPTGTWVQRYAGIDSNFPSQIVTWPVEAVDRAAKATGNRPPLLITDRATYFGRHNVRYTLQPDGRVYRRG